VTLARIGNPPRVWQRLTEALAVELAALTTASPVSPAAAPIIDDVQAAAGAAGVSRRGGVRELAENYLQIAHTGVYDSARYGSPSQARQAVITAAVWAGMSMVDVLARISDGRWRGLASFYARYSNSTSWWEALSKFDWPNAVAYVTAQRGKNPGLSLVRQSLTSESRSHRGAPEQARLNRNTQGEFRFLRTWWSAMAIAEQNQQQLGDKPSGWMSRRMVLRALGEAGMKSGSRYVHFGTRSLSVAAGMDQSTVAAQLQQFGVLETIRKTVQRHRDERAAYRRVLQMVEAKPILSPDPADWCWPPPDPPPQDDVTALDLLERILGAHPVPA